MGETTKQPWKVSLHGGHSGSYCDHAQGTLREVLEAAVAWGYDTFGLSEHAPRLGEDFLYDTERALGWDVAKIEADFERYAEDSKALAEEFAPELRVLRGFEIEVVPHDRYVEIMSGYRERHDFDYIVGSVHFIDGVLIDGPEEEFAKAVDMHGGLENLGVRYYETVAQMIRDLRPEVVGHLDLIRKNAPSNEAVETPRLRAAAEATLGVAKSFDCILDLNTAGYRKGLGTPYPAPWLLTRAHEMGLGFCFGDDSHGPQQVGAGLDDARHYLLDHGIDHITALTSQNGAIVPHRVPLK